MWSVLDDGCIEINLIGEEWRTLRLIRQWTKLIILLKTGQKILKWSFADPTCKYQLKTEKKHVAAGWACQDKNKQKARLLTFHEVSFQTRKTLQSHYCLDKCTCTGYKLLIRICTDFAVKRKKLNMQILRKCEKLLYNDIIIWLAKSSWNLKFGIISHFFFFSLAVHACCRVNF